MTAEERARAWRKSISDGSYIGDRARFISFEDMEQKVANAIRAAEAAARAEERDQIVEMLMVGVSLGCSCKDCAPLALAAAEIRARGSEEK